MTENIFENLEKGLEIRQSLIDLRQMLREDKSGNVLAEMNADRTDLLIDFLSDEDPKVRRNAALILGELGDDSLLEVLMYSYRHEDTLFIREDYLAAISKLHYESLLDELKRRLDEIEKTELDEENRKHLMSEARQLRAMILKAQPAARHEFTGYETESEMVLMVSPGMEQVTADAIPEGLCSNIKTGNGAVFVSTSDIEKIMKLRTVKGFLFRFCKNPCSSLEGPELAGEIVKAGIFNFISRRHKGQAPFYFRIDLRSRLVLHEKTRFISRMAEQIEELTDYKLLNSASDYEITIRVMENKAGKYAVYLEMNSIPDRRFSYRKYALPTSTSPVRAAEIITLAGPYIKSGAAVLDPFCGTGSLLIERRVSKNAKFLYGVDRYGEAVRMAKKNAQRAGMDIFFINKDCLEFEHRYMFDEIITELPAVTERMGKKEISNLYYGFLKRIYDWVEIGGRIIMCTSVPDLLLPLVKKNRFLKIEDTIKLSGKRGDTLVICTVQKPA